MERRQGQRAMGGVLKYGWLVGRLGGLDCAVVMMHDPTLPCHHSPQGRAAAPAAVQPAITGAETLGVWASHVMPTTLTQRLRESRSIAWSEATPCDPWQVLHDL
jgi:hypothetical protein